MTVRQLTLEQKDNLVGIEFAASSSFNPIQDINDAWVISEEEVEQCNDMKYCWVKDLPEIEYIPKPYPEIII